MIEPNYSKDIKNLSIAVDKLKREMLKLQTSIRKTNNKISDLSNYVVTIRRK